MVDPRYVRTAADGTTAKTVTDQTSASTAVEGVNAQNAVDLKYAFIAASWGFVKYAVAPKFVRTNGNGLIAVTAWVFTYAHMDDAEVNVSHVVAEMHLVTSLRLIPAWFFLACLFSILWYFHDDYLCDHHW